VAFSSRSLWDGLLNISLLFGLTNPGQTSVVVGGWSIGIELVFYALFPALLVFVRDMRTMLLTLLAFFLLRVAFVEPLLRDSDLASAWDDYTQPGAFLVFFFGGMVVAKLMQGRDARQFALLGFIGLGALLALYGQTREEILLGVPGALYALLSIALVALFFWSPKSPALAAVCQFFGDISYGLYIFHPLAWRALEGLDVLERSFAALLAATGLAWLTLRIYERPTRRWLLRAS
jgi:exopolysaccharide production protein ExoZ